MSKENKQDINNEEIIEDNELESNEESEVEVVEEVKEITIESLQEDIAKLNEEKLLLLANLQNERKAINERQMDFIKYAHGKFAEDILPAIEMFSGALKADGVSEELKNWLLGFEMIEKQFISALESNGINLIQPKVGDKFDSKQHQVVDVVETEDESKEDSITSVKKKGYMIHDRLLIPAAVIVAKKKTEEVSSEDKKEN